MWKSKAQVPPGPEIFAKKIEDLSDEQLKILIAREVCRIKWNTQKTAPAMEQVLGMSNEKKSAYQSFSGYSNTVRRIARNLCRLVASVALHRRQIWLSGQPKYFRLCPNDYCLSLKQRQAGGKSQRQGISQTNDRYLPAIWYRVSVKTTRLFLTNLYESKDEVIQFGRF